MKTLGIVYQITPAWELTNQGPGGTDAKRIGLPKTRFQGGAGSLGERKPESENTGGKGPAGAGSQSGRVRVNTRHARGGKIKQPRRTVGGVSAQRADGRPRGPKGGRQGRKSRGGADARRAAGGKGGPREATKSWRRPLGRSASLAPLPLSRGAKGRLAAVSGLEPPSAGEAFSLLPLAREGSSPWEGSSPSKRSSQ